METRTFLADESAHKQRLDKFLCERCGDLSRSYVQQLIAEGHVQQDGAAIAQPSAKVKSGATYRLHIPEVIPLALEPVPMALDIVFEDDQLLVINKPAGLTVHPAPGTKEPTLVHGLLAHCGESLSGIGGVARPGIVHRLDKDTSGLMLVAKTDAAHQSLSAQLKDRSLSRTYEALCWGIPNPPRGTIHAPIARHPKDRTRMAVVRQGGKDAVTHYETLHPFRIAMKDTMIPFASHVRCRLESGRTHQIRVHLSHLGHGLLGDPLYGMSTDQRLKRFRIDLNLETLHVITHAGQQALHAAMLCFKHPVTQHEMTFSVPLPPFMTQLLSALNHLQNDRGGAM